MSFENYLEASTCPSAPHPTTSGVHALVIHCMGEAVISQTGEIGAVCQPLVSVLLLSGANLAMTPFVFSRGPSQLPREPFPFPFLSAMWRANLDKTPGYTRKLSVSTLQTQSVEVGIHLAGLRKGLCSRTKPRLLWGGLEVNAQRQPTVKKPNGNHLCFRSHSLIQHN